MVIDKDSLFAGLPPEWPADLLPDIRCAVERSAAKIVVLDDDPTGTQTVHGISVLTGWDVDSLITVLSEPESIVYILTNSRSLSLDQAQELNRELVRNLVTASRSTERKFSIISRSDSTLRGHFPGEVEAILEALDQDVDGILIIPFFEEGGRFTAGDIHYVEEEGGLVPAGETEYARDASFGYHSSNLRHWVCEKYQPRVNIEDVASISLELVRRGGPLAVERALLALQECRLCVVNAASYRDIEVIVTGLLRAEDQGKRFIFRTAASFVRVRGGIQPRGLLRPDDLGVVPGACGGLIIAGSYIQKSTLQIEALQALDSVRSLEVSVPVLLDVTRRSAEIHRVALEASRLLISGRDVCVYTSRQVVSGTDARESLQISAAISQALVEIVRSIEIPPAWIIAKGGITASDIATQALQVKIARVMGQIAPGVSVWRTAKDSRWPEMVYIVFPGNVGGPQAIAQVVAALHQVG